MRDFSLCQAIFFHKSLSSRQLRYTCLQHPWFTKPKDFKVSEVMRRDPCLGNEQEWKATGEGQGLSFSTWGQRHLCFRSPEFPQLDSTPVRGLPIQKQSLSYYSRWVKVKKQGRQASNSKNCYLIVMALSRTAHLHFPLSPCCWASPYHFWTLLQ